MTGKSRLEGKIMRSCGFNKLVQLKMQFVLLRDSKNVLVCMSQLFPKWRENTWTKLNIGPITPKNKCWLQYPGELEWKLFPVLLSIPLVPAVSSNMVCLMYSDSIFTQVFPDIQSCGLWAIPFHRSPFYQRSTTLGDLENWSGIVSVSLYF